MVYVIEALLSLNSGLSNCVVLIMERVTSTLFESYMLLVYPSESRSLSVEEPLLIGREALNLFLSPSSISRFSYEILGRAAVKSVQS